MAVSHTLATLGRLIWRTPPPPPDLLEAYAHEVIPVLDRAEWLYTYWLEQSTLFTDSEKLGNVAAIHRWETATMGRSLERVIPPAVLAGAHESVIDALEMASRAAQLLSNGSRFHNANAVCEGQAMLTVSRERRLNALRSMRRYLSTVPAPATPELDAEAGSAPLDQAASGAELRLQPGQVDVDTASPAESVGADAADGLAHPDGGPIDGAAVLPTIDSPKIDRPAIDTLADLTETIVDPDHPPPSFLAFVESRDETSAQAASSDDQAAEHPSPAGSDAAANGTASPSVGDGVSAPSPTTPERHPATPEAPAVPPAPAQRPAPSHEAVDDEPPARSSWGSLFGR